MAPTYYFYDLETSGLNPRTDRIMQFAGQRTDLDFRPIGEPDNILVSLSDDTLPGPWAIMTTGITPQMTKQDGISEREFCRFFVDRVAMPETTIIGYNSVRFDDEFMRATLWRNFHDAYAWQWKDGRSRWDLLDVVRLVRALRPEGIEWPVDEHGHATNRLELITKCNQISHEHAHDALADVTALIEVTKLLKKKQPKMYDFLFKMRDKKLIMQLVNLEKPQSFVYASGRLPGEFNKTTVAYPIASARNGNVLVFDLRYNIEELLKEEAAAKPRDLKDVPYRERKPWERDYFPIVKMLQYNHCPAVAPLGVLEKEDGWQKISLSREQVEENLAALKRHPEFIKRMAGSKIGSHSGFLPAEDAESALYDSFLSVEDNRIAEVIRNDEDFAKTHQPKFKDERLKELYIHFRAKNFPETLNADEQENWQNYRQARLTRQSKDFWRDIQSIQKKLQAGEAVGAKPASEYEFLVEELLLWYQSLQD